MQKRILITGALGQIGTELVPFLRNKYGVDNVIATNRSLRDVAGVTDVGIFEQLDALDKARLTELVDKHQINTIIHLAAVLSAVGEQDPARAYDINMNSLLNVLEVARAKVEAGQPMMVFTPSSIAAFGPSTPKDQTPQDTLQRPTTMYGITKVAGELLCDYYHSKFGVDTRGVRFPGLISYQALPGGGTTDYAVHIFYEAIKNGRYDSFIKAGTLMDMMYMPDALQAIYQLMEADGDKLIHRNAFNITAMSFEPEALAAEIKKHLPEFELSYQVDPIRQDIADSWPNSLDDSAARTEWDWSPQYNLSSMTKDMLDKLRQKLK